MLKKTFQLEALTCPSCIQNIETVLARTKGVREVKVLFHSSKVKVSFDEHVVSGDTIKQTLGDLGYEVIGVPS
ncbi:heavy-metal-associated domain-containing protein [Numidum massiliense]|uniref:heavy-metal-associated domain-containing protein n=1 Tax=Numidum massiliense TaxID=1522315 RepID=UPI0006D53959|nr:cation transporter [Numidum massiliense]